MSALKTGWAELVIWQVGTNDAIVGVDEALSGDRRERRRRGARGPGAAPADRPAIYAEKLRIEPRYERFVAIVDEIGARDHVPVLSRFAMMKQRGRKGARTLLSGDGLHMNDLGYRCLAHAIAEAIEGAAGAKL